MCFLTNMNLSQKLKRCSGKIWCTDKRMWSAGKITKSVRLKSMRRGWLWIKCEEPSQSDKATIDKILVL